MRPKPSILLMAVLIALISLAMVGCNGNGTTPTSTPTPEPTPGSGKVCIDPGHGGSDPGALGWDDMVSDGGGCEWKYDSQPDFPNEADINLDIALKLNTILRDQGFVVVMTRATDADVTLSERAEKTNNENCDIFVSIHGNAQACKFDKSKPEDDAYGTETYYWATSTDGARLAHHIQDELVKSIGRSGLDRGTKTADFYVLKHTKMPAVLVEVAFLTNKTDFEYIRSHTQDAAQGIANGILKYFGRETMASGLKPAPTPTELYTLSVSISPSGSGSVTPSSGDFSSGTQVALSAVPAPGYAFTCWRGDASGNSPTATITMNGGKNITACFEKIPATFNLSIAVNGEGTTNPRSGTHTYDESTQVSVAASPASGWRFDHWGGDASGTSTTVVITMDSNKSVTAYFRQVAAISSNVQITHIFYDGLVPRAESDEYVEIINLGDEPQDLAGWVLKDISEGYPSLTFPSYVLAPGASIRVYTNEIHPEWGGFSFGYGKAIWNNTDPDVAALFNAQGREMSRKSY